MVFDDLFELVLHLNSLRGFSLRWVLNSKNQAFYRQRRLSQSCLVRIICGRVKVCEWADKLGVGRHRAEGKREKSELENRREQAGDERERIPDE
jgi:hypothetical protein